MRQSSSGNKRHGRLHVFPVSCRRSSVALVSRATYTAKMTNASPELIRTETDALVVTSSRSGRSRWSRSSNQRAAGATSNCVRRHALTWCTGASLFAGIVVTLTGYGPLRLLLVGIEDSGIGLGADLGRDAEQLPTSPSTANQSAALMAVVLSAQVKVKVKITILVDSMRFWPSSVMSPFSNMANT
jgi:hypothetical protein